MTDPKSAPKGMRRNLANYGDAGFSVFLRKAFIKALGYSDDALERPIIGIVNTDSGFNACHSNIPDLITAASRGVMLAGGIPIPFPVISIQESFANPTSMYLRNLMAMDVEEMIRAQPMDAVILLGGCDKTVPALVMGAASANVPAILLVTGPMLAGSFRGEKIGACTDCRRFWAKYRAGGMTDAEFALQYLILAHSGQHPELLANAGNIALLQRAEEAGLLPAGVGRNAANAYRELRRLQHRARLDEQSTALDEAAQAAQGTAPLQAAVRALWQAVFPPETAA